MRRLLAGILLLVLVSVLIFVGTQVLPGDAASAILGRDATPGALSELRAELRLDRPVTTQYFDWLAGLLHGDLGVSLAANEPVSQFIDDRARNTLILALLAFALIIPLSLVLGVIAGINPERRVDHLISSVTLGAIALPEFVTGTLLATLFAVSLSLLPPISLVAAGSSPLSSPSVLVLPVVTLLLAGLAYNVRMVRAGVAQVMESEYVQAARLNGLSERRIIRRHVLPNALAPSIQVFALTVQWLIGGVVVVETVFQYPGIGQGLVEAVNVRDIPVVQAVAIMIAALYIVINIVADILVVLLIPKLRTAL